MNLEALIRDVKAGKIAPVYMLYGDDEYPIQEAVKLLKATVAAGPMAQFNLDELSGTSLSWANVLERARTLPMMSPRRLVVGWDVDKLLKKDDDDAEALLGYLAAPLAETVLVFTAKAVDKRTKLGKTLTGKGVAVLEAGHPKPAEVPALVTRFVAAFGKRIDQTAARALADLIGTETMWIRNEVEKLCLYVGERPDVTLDDVQAVMADINARQVWDLTDALAKKDFALCMKVLEPIARESEPPMIFGALANEIRKLAKVKRLVEARRSRDDMAKEIGGSPWLVDKLLGNARAFSVNELNEIYRRLEATDLRLKRTNQSSRLVLESLIADICLS